MTAPLYDVIVAGGGPAGSTAGLRLARAGCKALLVDRSGFPRDKPCGGGLSLRVLRRFPYLEEALGRTAVHRVHRVRLESPDGTSFLEERREPLYMMVRRAEFDALLLGLARGAGLEFRPGFRVVGLERGQDAAELVSADGQRIRARLVIGADGVNSMTAKASGLNPAWPQDRVAADFMEETPSDRLEAADPDTMHVFYGLGGAKGYGYVFPKAGRVNVGSGALVSDLKALPKGETAYRKHLAFVDRLKARGILRGSSVRTNFHGYRIPLGGALRKTYGERLLLAGDAAGLVNAFTGEGVYFAMVSGEHAAEAALEALRERSFADAGLSRYQSRWAREIGEELRQAAAVQRVLFDEPARIDRIVRAAAGDADLRTLLTDYAVGLADVRAARRRLISRFLPMYLGHKLGKLRSALKGGRR